MRRLLVCAFLLSGCGPAIEPGTYAMEVHYTRDDLPNSMAGQTVGADWVIRDHGDDWSLVVRGGASYTGQLDNQDQLVFRSRSPYWYAVIKVAPAGDDEWGAGWEIDGSGRILVADEYVLEACVRGARE